MGVVPQQGRECMSAGLASRCHQPGISQGVLKQPRRQPANPEAKSPFPKRYGDCPWPGGCPGPHHKGLVSGRGRSDSLRRPLCPTRAPSYWGHAAVGSMGICPHQAQVRWGQAPCSWPQPTRSTWEQSRHLVPHRAPPSHLHLPPHLPPLTLRREPGARVNSGPQVCTRARG